jgi:hypothetical protein
MGQGDMRVRRGQEERYIARKKEERERKKRNSAVRLIDEEG